MTLPRTLAHPSSNRLWSGLLLWGLILFAASAQENPTPSTQPPPEERSVLDGMSLNRPGGAGRLALQPGPLPAPTTPTNPPATPQPSENNTEPLPTLAPLPTESSPPSPPQEAPPAPTREPPKPSFPPTEERELSLTLLTLSPDNQGAAARLKLRWKHAKDHSPLQVAVSERRSGTSGETLRASLWMAAAVAQLQLENALLGGRIELSNSQPVEGPSAGALFGLGMVCLLREKTIPPDTTMTGTLNPDGSIGPVAGIPEKMTSAHAAKITRLLLPACQRTVRDPATGTTVDIAALAASLPIHVEFAATLSEAYALITGEPLHPTQPSSIEPTLPDAVKQTLSNECRSLLEKIETARASSSKSLREKRFRPAAESLQRWTLEQEADGRNAFQTGRLWAAYRRLSSAQAGLSVLGDLGSLERLDEEVIAGWSLESSAIAERLISDTLRAAPDPTSASRSLVFSHALVEMQDMHARIRRSQIQLERATRALAAAPAKGDDRRKLEKERDYFALQLFFSNRYAHHRSDTLFWEKLAAMAPSAPVISDDNASAWLPALLQTQLSASTIFGDISRRYPDTLRDDILADHTVVAFSDITRLADQQSSAQTQKPNPKNPPLPFAFPITSAPLHRLMLWANACADASVLLQKYSGLGAVRDESLGWHIRNRSAFVQMLESAQRQARAAIARARRSGVETWPLTLTYEMATWERDAQTDAEKLRALRDYWRIALLGQILPPLLEPPTTAPAAENDDMEMAP